MIFKYALYSSKTGTPVNVIPTSVTPSQVCYRRCDSPSSQVWLPIEVFLERYNLYPMMFSAYQYVNLSFEEAKRLANNNPHLITKFRATDYFSFAVRNG